MALGLSTHLYLESLFNPGSETESKMSRQDKIKTFWSLLLAERYNPTVPYNSSHLLDHF